MSASKISTKPKTLEGKFYLTYGTLQSYIEHGVHGDTKKNPSRCPVRKKKKKKKEGTDMLQLRGAQWAPGRPGSQGPRARSNRRFRGITSGRGPARVHLTQSSQAERVARGVLLRRAAS
eukprot:2572082-Pyramimonas_sp.AAC.1